MSASLNWLQIWWVWLACAGARSRGGVEGRRCGSHGGRRSEGEVAEEGAAQTLWGGGHGHHVCGQVTTTCSRSFPCFSSRLCSRFSFCSLFFPPFKEKPDSHTHSLVTGYCSLTTWISGLLMETLDNLLSSWPQRVFYVEHQFKRRWNVLLNMYRRCLSLSSSHSSQKSLFRFYSTSPECWVLVDSCRWSESVLDKSVCQEWPFSTKTKMITGNGVVIFVLLVKKLSLLD